jgi:hypothetical protein
MPHPDKAQVKRLAGDSLLVDPAGLKPPFKLASLAAVPEALCMEEAISQNCLVRHQWLQLAWTAWASDAHRREKLKGLAVFLQALQLAGEPDGAVATLAPVEGADAHGVTGCAEVPGALVHNDACEDAVERVPQLFAVAHFLVHVTHNGGVAGGHDLAARELRRPHLLMVVDLAVPVGSRKLAAYFSVRTNSSLFVYLSGYLRGSP